MNLIHYRGLNCYLGSIVSIAASQGLRDSDAFATLWPETEFAYDPRHRIYSSPRLLGGLKASGVVMEALPCGVPGEARGGLSRLARGEAILVGMDTFMIPWSPFYQYRHEPHYFIARKDGGQAFACFDPAYNEAGMPLGLRSLADSADMLVRVRMGPAEPMGMDLRRVAAEVLQTHPGLIIGLPEKIRACGEAGSVEMSRLTAWVDAMIGNRHLFQHYLHDSPHAPGHARHSFDGDFLLRWEAVKNGLIKASILRRNEAVVDEVCGLTQALLRAEMEMARAILRRGPAPLSAHGNEAVYIG